MAELLVYQHMDLLVKTEPRGSCEPCLPKQADLDHDNHYSLPIQLWVQHPVNDQTSPCRDVRSSINLYKLGIVGNDQSSIPKELSHSAHKNAGDSGDDHSFHSVPKPGGEPSCLPTQLPHPVGYCFLH